MGRPDDRWNTQMLGRKTVVHPGRQRVRCRRSRREHPGRSCHQASTAEVHVALS
jgi:hypothetical protein